MTKTVKEIDARKIELEKIHIMNSDELDEYLTLDSIRPLQKKIEQQARQIKRQAKTIEDNDWVDCNVRLPEEHNWFLVNTEEGFQLVMWWIDDKKENNGFYMSSWKEVMGKVTHWQPIIAPK